MAKLTYDGNIKVWFVPTLTTPAAPSLAEITAGTDLTPFLRGGNLLPFAGSTVDAGTADSRFNSTVPGTFGGQEATIELTRDDTSANDDAWTALPRDQIGYIVIAWLGGSGASNAIAASDEVTTAQVQVISREMAAYGRNELARFTATLAILDTPDEDVTVAA